MTEIQEDIQRTVRRVFVERMRRLQLRGPECMNACLMSGGYVDGLMDGLNAILDMAGVARIQSYDKEAYRP